MCATTAPFRLICIAILIFMLVPLASSAQSPEHYIRIARIVVDSAQLDQYKAALKEGVQSAIQKEPGVLQLYAVYDKAHPTHVTVFEIYASVEAYQLHIQTDHFKKYKATVQGMVKSLELTDVMPIALERKQQ